MNRVDVCVAFALLTTGCSDRIGHGWDWNRMRHQPKASTYGAAVALPGGSAMQIPPAGTVPADSDEPAVMHSAGRGTDRYQIFCGICHGAAADGRSLIAENMRPPRPPSLVSGAAAALTGATIDSVIVHGSGTMMGFGADIPAADRSAIIDYLRQLRSASVARQ